MGGVTTASRRPEDLDDATLAAIRGKNIMVTTASRRPEDLDMAP